MAGSSLLALLDDIVVIMDDVAIGVKKAATKTAGVIGDDIAVNAEQLIGARPNREIPVVMQVAKGSLINKGILIPAALGISAFAPWAITPLLMCGGAFLCYEGAEKIAHSMHKKKHPEDHHKTPAALDPKVTDVVAQEKEKIKGAVRTDFILSAEILVLSLGTVAAAPFVTQLGVLTAIGLGVTAGVYGLVAGVLKMDDLGLLMTEKEGKGFFADTIRSTGHSLVNAAPKLMKTLSVVGTAAMFMVGGGILMHGIPGVGDTVHHFAHSLHHIANVGPFLEGAVNLLTPLVGGMAAGGAAIVAMKPVSKIIEKITQKLKKNKEKEASKHNHLSVNPSVEINTPSYKLDDDQQTVQKKISNKFITETKTPPDISNKFRQHSQGQSIDSNNTNYIGEHKNTTNMKRLTI
jgi:predicted DNA repair protein MutK